MEALKKEEFPKKKIFFISSNQSKLDQFIDYQIAKVNRGIINLKSGNNNSELKEIIKYKNNTFSIYINSIEIELNDLKDEDLEPQTNKYHASIYLRYNKTNFPSNKICFLPSKNNFIFDFKFKEYKGWGLTYDPPPQINFSLLEQFKFFIKYLRLKKMLQKDEIFRDLIIDSQSVCFGKKIYIDFYLEIFRNCYSDRYVLNLLDSFEIKNIIFPKEIDYKSYSVVLHLVEKKPDMLTKYCERDEDKKKYYIKFFTLLFHVRYYYDKEKVNNMLKCNYYWEYLIKILPNNSLYFPNLDISKELMNAMFEQNLTADFIINILRLCKTIEQILVIINDKIDIISDIFLKEEKMINMSLFGITKADNLEIIMREMEKIFVYQKNKNLFFISFDEYFWKNSIDFSEDVRELIEINNIIILYSNLDNNLKNLNLQEKIHNIGLESINKGKLINDELLYFIKNDIYFSDNKYENINDRPLDIIKGLDFGKMSDNFFENWATLNIFNIYSFAISEFKTGIIDKNEDITNFGKLLNLFDYKNKDIFDNELISKLCEKFKNLIITYNPERCPKFIEDIAYFIYIIDFQKSIDINKFMKDIIEHSITKDEKKIDICIYLFENYKDISETLNDYINDIIINNFENVNNKIVPFFLEKLKSQRDNKLLLDKLGIYTIKEEELFNPKKDIKSFILLKGIQENGLFEQFNIGELKNSKYFINTSQNIEKIYNKIKFGEIKYNSFKIIDLTDENTNIFIEKLNILFFNDKEKVNECMKILTKRYINSVEKILFLKKTMFKFNGDENYKEDLIRINNLINLIKSSMLNEIEKQEVIKEINEIDNIFNKVDQEKINKYKASEFFKQIYNMKKSYNNTSKKESEYLELAINDFNKLKLLFESQKWYEELQDQLIMECFECIKNKKRDNLRKELMTLIQIFEIEEFDDLKMNSLIFGLLSFCQKEEILLIAKNFNNIIIELEALQTDFFKELEQIRNGLLTKFDFDNITKLEKILEYFGFNILDPDEYDRNYIDLFLINFEEGFFKFIANVNDSEIKKLEQLVGKAEDILVNNNDIQEMIRCFNFIHNLGNIKGIKKDKDLIIELINEVQKTKGIVDSFKNYSKCSGKIQELLSK